MRALRLILQVCERIYKSESFRVLEVRTLLLQKLFSHVFSRVHTHFPLIYCWYYGYFSSFRTIWFKHVYLSLINSALGDLLGNRIIVIFGDLNLLDCSFRMERKLMKLYLNLWSLCFREFKGLRGLKFLFFSSRLLFVIWKSMI